VLQSCPKEGTHGSKYRHLGIGQVNTRLQWS
jgi:hypothetical protein